MALRIVFGDVYLLLRDWLSSQVRPFVAVPNMTAQRVLERRLAGDRLQAVLARLRVGRLGTLAASIIGPGEALSTLDLVIEREILRRLLPAEYCAFANHDPFMDQIVRELDDLRRNLPDGADAAALVASADVAEHDRHAFELAIALLQREREMVSSLADGGLFLGGDFLREARRRISGDAKLEWSGVAVVAVHRLDTVSISLLRALAGYVDVVLLPGPETAHVRAIVAGWRLGITPERDGRRSTAFATHYLGGAGPSLPVGAKPVIRAFPDPEREIRGVVRDLVQRWNDGRANRCLVAAPRVDRYAEVIPPICAEFALPCHVGGLRFFASLPIDRFVQSLLRYVTAPPEEEKATLGELLVRAGWGFAPFRISALRDRMGSAARTPKDWLASVEGNSWPDYERERLRRTLNALGAERKAWQERRPGPEWLRRVRALLAEHEVVENLGRNLLYRARRTPDPELPWEGQGTSSYLDRMDAFGESLAAGANVGSLSWTSMDPQEFVRLYTGDVSYGSFLPRALDANAARFLDLEDLLFAEVDELWVIGFAEGALPLDYSTPILIPERVRASLASQVGILDRERHLLLQRGTFEKAFSAPLEALHFTYPYQDERAHTRLPSPFALAYGILTGGEIEAMIRARRQAQEFFARVLDEPVTEREALAVVAANLRRPAPRNDPAAVDNFAAAMAGAVRTLHAHVGVASMLAKGRSFRDPPSVVDVTGCDTPPPLPDPLWSDRLVDAVRCPFRLYARCILNLSPPRAERWPEEPIPALESLLLAALAPAEWSRLMSTVPSARLAIFQEMASSVVRREDSMSTRSFRQFIAFKANEYVSSLISARTEVSPMALLTEVSFATDYGTVRQLVDRIDMVGAERVAVMLVSQPSEVQRLWLNGFGESERTDPVPPDPRAAMAALVTHESRPVDAVELQALLPAREGREAPFLRARTDRAEATTEPNRWAAKDRHLGAAFTADAENSVKAAAAFAAGFVAARRFPIAPHANGQAACDSCRMGQLCRRRWLPAQPSVVTTLPAND